MTAGRSRSAMDRLTHHEGFALLELLICIVLIAVLSMLCLQ
ncbi:MAG: prepilin-type N-terminal cleavage/methylation domain-containing protein, partial [Solobacterium sp.]|nr:prepilin-type N-terminal cleavage/methylation domain-containing protein [Solobacterium sp.]